MKRVIESAFLAAVLIGTPVLVHSVKAEEKKAEAPKKEEKKEEKKDEKKAEKK